MTGPLGPPRARAAGEWSSWAAPQSTAATIPRHVALASPAVTEAAANGRIPRDRENDYTREQAQTRRAFAEERTGVSLEHVSSYSFDPAILPGNVENFIGVAQVPIGLAGPLARQRRARPGRVLRAAGHRRGHAGRELQPRDAAAARGRRRHHDDPRRRACSGRPSFLFPSAREARDFARLAQRALRRHQAASRSPPRARASCATSSSTPPAGCCSPASTTRRATPPART